MHSSKGSENKLSLQDLGMPFKAAVDLFKFALEVGHATATSGLDLACCVGDPDPRSSLALSFR